MTARVRFDVVLRGTESVPVYSAVGLYTEKQMHAAVAAERERCKDLVRRYMPLGWSAVYDAMTKEQT